MYSHEARPPVRKWRFWILEDQKVEEQADTWFVARDQAARKLEVHPEQLQFEEVL